MPHSVSSLSSQQPVLDQPSISTPCPASVSLSGQPSRDQLITVPSSLTTTVPVQKHKSLKTNGPRKRLTNNSFLQQTLALNSRAIQLKREKLRLEKRRVAALEVIACELTTIRSVLCVTSNVNVVDASDCNTAKENEM